MTRKAIVFLGMTYPHGIIRHFALLAIEIARIFRCSGNVDFFFASTDGETNQNSWPLVEAEFDQDRIIKESDFGCMAEKICNLASKYEKVVVHMGGGWGQTKHFVKARKRMNKMHAARLAFIGTTHSFRHDSIHRVWMSALQCLLYLRYYDKIVFQCKYTTEIFTGASLLFKLGKAIIIPLGCEEFPSVQDKTPETICKAGLESICCDESLFKMVYLAQFRPGKMHAWLVKSLVPVLKANPNARLILCGMGVHKVIANVKTIVAKNGLNEQVVIPGQIPRFEIPWLLKRVQCALVPSRAETFGHNFIEPMFAHLPVVGTKVGIGREIIEDGKTGFGFSLKQPMELQKAISTMIKNPVMTKEMGEMAYAKVCNAFRHSDVAKRLVALYQQVLADRV